MLTDIVTSSRDEIVSAVTMATHHRHRNDNRLRQKLAEHPELNLRHVVCAVPPYFWGERRVYRMTVITEEHIQNFVDLVLSMDRERAL